MKKLGYIAIGIMIGSVLSFGVGAAADSISLVGKKISGETDVLVNGAKLGTAIIVNGSSYAPVRVIGEAAGFEVGFIDKKVVLGTAKEEVVKPVETPTTLTKEQEISAFISKKNSLQKEAMDWKMIVIQKENDLKNAASDKKPTQKEMDELYAKGAEIEKKLEDLKKEEVALNEKYKS